jgi:Spy/CpxP family protein refolding chaperone
MRLLVSAVLLALATAVPAGVQAQNPGGPPQGPGGPPPQGGAGRRMQMLMNGITLTAEQQTRVDSIVAAYRAQMPPFTPGQMPDSATMARRRQLGEQQNAAIRGVLTPDQQTVFDRNVEQMRQMAPPQGGPPRP